MTIGEAPVIHINNELLQAAFKGQSSELRVLLEPEEDMSEKLKDSQTALLLASVRGHTESVNILLDAGVDVNGKTVRDGTALMWAAGGWRTCSCKDQ
jgi:serine/threonine-protein phosphatase 6 regulatory ankyrin repeat subunit B